MKAKCRKCYYKWNTESPMVLVSCPSCGSKVRIRDIVKLTRIKENNIHEVATKVEQMPSDVKEKDECNPSNNKHDNNGGIKKNGI